MKAIIIAVVAVIVMMVALQFQSTETITYIKESAMEVAEEPKEAWMIDEEAIQAAKDVIKKKELQAELEKLDADIKSLQERRKVVTGELTTYWSEDKVKALIRQVFWEDPITAVAVAMAESRLKPYALNAQDSHSGCNGSYGIFQIGCLHETDPSTLYDVEYNVKRAKEIYVQSGWRPWGAYTNKSYLAYVQ